MIPPLLPGEKADPSMPPLEEVGGHLLPPLVVAEPHIDEVPIPLLKAGIDRHDGDIQLLSQRIIALPLASKDDDALHIPGQRHLPALLHIGIAVEHQEISLPLHLGLHGCDDRGDEGILDDAGPPLVLVGENQCDQAGAPAGHEPRPHIGDIALLLQDPPHLFKGLSGDPIPSPVNHIGDGGRAYLRQFRDILDTVQALPPKSPFLRCIISRRGRERVSIAVFRGDSAVSSFRILREAGCCLTATADFKSRTSKKRSSA